jgi:DNA-binding MarR family transcriptional regulator
MQRPPDDDVETWATGRLLSAAARLVEHEWNAHLARWDLNHASLAVLHVLSAGPLTQREIAARVQVEDQTMSRTLDRLERSEYVERHRDDDDRRRVVVSLTASGRKTCMRASDLAVAESFFSDAVEEVEALRRSLVGIVRALSQQRWPQMLPAEAARVAREDADPKPA